MMQRLSAAASRYMLSEEMKDLPEWYWDLYDVVSGLYGKFGGKDIDPSEIDFQELRGEFEADFAALELPAPIRSAIEKAMENSRSLDEFGRTVGKIIEGV